MKISMKRLGAMIMALVMVFGLIPVMNNTANAVDVSGLTDETIGVSYTLANNPLTGVAGVTAPTGNSLTIVGAGKLVGSNYMSCVNTVTITNNKTTKATLSFDYTLSGTFGTVAIDGTSYTAATSSSYSKELEAGESITIKVTPKRTNKASGGNELTVAITSMALVAAGVGPITATFEAPAYGSYTVAYGDTTLTVAAGTASQEATNEASVAYTLTVTPGQGYKLVGWYDSVSGNYLSTDASFVAYFDKAATVRPIIVPENTAVFLVGTNYYSDLNEAVEYAQDNALTQITLVQSGILEDNGENYVIPAGITLLIPMDTEYTATGFDEFGPAPEFTTEVVAPYAYLTLTLGEGVVLEINGTLDIESKHTTAQGSGSARPYGGRPSGAYGAIYMSPETNITVNDGGSVYAWGYIYGQGTVDAASGAQVYELMQVLDFPGGSNMAGFVDSDPAYDFNGDTNPTNDYIKTFPFSQYYVQNIEVEMNLYAGATEYVYIAMSAASISMGMPVKFIGDGGMFFAESGLITKKYDPSTDRLEVTVDGDASMSGITLDMTGTEYESAMLQFLGVSKVDSSTFILTLNSNITIDIVSGTTTVKQDLALLPGVEVYVREGASMVIAQREFADGEHDNLTVYGTGGYNVYLWDKENWGKYAFLNQYLIPLSYSPTSGRYTRSYSDLKDVVLCIDGTVIVEGFLYSTVTIQEEENGMWIPISGGASVISNGTGKLVLTNGCGIEELAYCLDGSSSCDYNMYVDSVWLQNGDGSFLKTECGYCNFTDDTLEDCQNYGTEYYYCDVHECWYTSGHGNCTAAVEITWVINGQGQTMEVTVGEVPAYPITPSKPQSGCTVYTFAGWAASPDGEILPELPVATADAAYYAIFTESVTHTGELDYTDNGDTHSAVYDCCGAEYVTGEGHTYTEGLCACGKKQTFTIKWNNNGTIMETDVVEYGEVPVYNGATPTKTAVGYTYTFTNWSPAVVAATKDMIYNAVYSASVNSHFVILKDENGTELGRVEYEYNVIISQNTLDAYAQKKCYTLDGWYYENGQSFSSTRMGDEDIVLIAKWNGPNHSWVDADCDNDGYCSVCGEAGDPALGHSYNYDCDTNCSVCGKLTRPEAECVSDAEYDCQDGNCIHCGEPVPASENHDWLDATCTEAATCGNCGATTGSALGHGYSKGWDYVQIDNDVHQVWCKDCYGYNYEDGHDYVNHVCSECGWTERMSVKFYNGDTLWSETTAEYGGALGISGMEVPAAPTGYTFAGWYAGDVRVVHGMTVTEDIVAYATWAKQTFTITWIVDGVSTEEVYEYGATPSFKGNTDKAPNGCTTYTFDGWDKDIVAVTGDVTYTAEYTTGISHTGDLEYTHVDEWTHKVTYSCCGAVVSEEAEHEDWDNDGYCNCGGVFIKILVNEATIYGEEMENGWQYIFVKPGSTYTTDVGPATGWGKVTVQIYDAGNDTSVINRNATQLVLGPEYTSAVNEDLTIFVYSYAEVIIDLNGGEVVDEFKEMLNKYDPENGIAAFDLPAGSITEFDMLKNAFVREGYTLIGITDGQTTYTGDEDITSDGEDLHLTLVWKDDHVCSENLTEVEAVEPDCDTNGVKAYWSCSCGKYYADANASTEIPDLALWKNGDGKIEKLGHGHTEGLGYTDLKNGNHSVTCKDCGEVIIESEGHDYTYDKRYHKCQCGAVEEFKLTVVYGVNGEYTFEAMLPYWTRMDSLDVINNIPWRVYVNDATHMGYFYLDDFYWDMDGDGDLDRDRYFTEGYMTDEDMYVEARYNFNGFVHDGIGWKYRDYGSFYKNVMVMLTMADVYENGSNEELEGIYMVGADGYRIENGMGRWYYLGYNPFSGITYEPNAEDIAYYESKGQTFIDKEMTWYYFGADGKMAENYTGLVGDSYVINGQAAWHIGLVEIDGEYYYFKGDEVNGGNIMVTGCDYNLSRNNTDFNMVVGGIYTFDNDGVMQHLFHGIVESDLFEGKRHYIGGRLTPGLGLMDLMTASTGEVRYFYVDSYGQLILDAEYYVGVNALGIKKGIYYFDAEGFMVIPEEEPGKSGLFFEEGKWYYYVDGAKAYCAGLIEIDGNWVYVKSDGSLATGVYYVTNTNDHATISSGDKCLFDENGFMQEALNGIIDGYYYVDNQIAYAAGLIEIDGIYYYVRSNGQIVTDCQYWITNVNDTGYEPGLYEFNADGWMSEIYVETFTGIKDGYFYVEDKIAYNAGLKQYNGGYIYVRSNGQIATGKYWITNHNGLLPEGFYDFGEDGFYYPPVPENAYLVKDVVKNTETDGFYGYLGTAEGILPQADGMLYIEVTDITYAEEILNAAGFDISVDSSDYWATQFGASVVGTATIMMPVTAGNFYVLFVNPADIDGEDCSVINGTISYKIWSTVECELKEVSIGQ